MITHRSELKDIDFLSSVQICHRKDHKPTNKDTKVEVCQLSEHSEMPIEAVGNDDSVCLEVVLTKHGYQPSRSSALRSDPTVAMAVMDNQRALHLLGRKKMTEKARNLTRSMLWDGIRDAY